MNTTIKTCTEDQHEIITNAERAYEAGEITREQRNEVITAAIAAETENFMLAMPENG